MIVVGSADLAERNSTFAWRVPSTNPGNNFEYHLKQFRAAIAGGAAQIMPYYGMPVGTSTTKLPSASTKESSPICRAELGFDGINRTDWGLVKDATILGQPMPARAWGVEHLDELSRGRDDLECRLRPARR